MKTIAILVILLMGVVGLGAGVAAGAPADGHCSCSAHNFFNRFCSVSGPCPCTCSCPFIGSCRCICGGGIIDNPVGG